MDILMSQVSSIEFKNEEKKEKNKNWYKKIPLKSIKIFLKCDRFSEQKNI